jgi:hypothetical protein
MEYKSGAVVCVEDWVGRVWGGKGASWLLTQKNEVLCTHALLVWAAAMKRNYGT